MKTWMITGASRGLGRAIAEAALASGDRVVATGRTLSKLREIPGPRERLSTLELDVGRPHQAIQVMQRVEAQFGTLDVLVNNAGYGQLGYFETIGTEAIVRQFDTNVLGLMHVTRAALPLMRRQHHGHIINLSSIGGTLGFDGASVYCATKFAVEGFSESLAIEVARFGISVTIVEPGFFRTDFLDASSVSYGDQSIDAYQEISADLRGTYDSHSHTQPGDPAKLAALVVEVANRPSPPLRLVAGADALAMSRELLTRRSTELEAWAEASMSTAYTDA